MKRIAVLLLAVLLLTACGSAPGPAGSTETPSTPAVPEEQETTEQTQEKAEETDADGEDEQMRKEESRGEAVSVTLDGISSYLRLTLPESWTWTEGQNEPERRSLILCAPTDDAFQVEMVWWDFFGICGTGVDFREIELAGGLKATLATESNSGYILWTLILPPSPDQFTLNFGAESDVYEAHRAEIDAILDSLRIGVLAEAQGAVQPRDSI